MRLVEVVVRQSAGLQEWALSGDLRLEQCFRRNRALGDAVRSRQGLALRHGFRASVARHLVTSEKEIYRQLSHPMPCAHTVRIPFWRRESVSEMGSSNTLSGVTCAAAIQSNSAMNRQRSLARAEVASWNRPSRPLWSVVELRNAADCGDPRRRSRRTQHGPSVGRARLFGAGL
jgi:hypothetical protein